MESIYCNLVNTSMLNVELYFILKNISMDRFYCTSGELPLPVPSFSLGGDGDSLLDPSVAVE